MILNGWKEIAAYLKCGVRTAQRWHRDLRLPVLRVHEDSERGPVMVHSESLDDWLRHRPANVTDDSALTRRAIRDHGQFLWIELETGRQLAKLAKSTRHDHVATRRRNAARKAYDTLQRFLAYPVSLPESELPLFRSELREFKQELEQLGETFDTPK